MDIEYPPYNSFKQSYHCYALDNLEGDKILMPLSTLDGLARMEIEYPMLFELLNPSTGRISHCGVLEFTAEEGCLFLPDWMMMNMKLNDGELAIIKNVSLKKGSYMKLQPHTQDFLEISNPKAVLERTLRNFSCLTMGDTIMIMYNQKKFYIDIIETKPSPAVSITETDCEVDFAPPLDYKEPEKEPVKKVEVEKPKVEEETKFKPFSGVPRRLGGNPSIEPIPPDCSMMLERKLIVADNGASSTTDEPNLKMPRKGQLVFGSNSVKSRKESKESIKEATLKKDEEKFKPFMGRSFRLKD